MSRDGRNSGSKIQPGLVRQRTRLPLNALRAFEVAARYESFVAAAEELNVTPAAISRHIRVLEEMLNEKLFVRYPQSIELTEFGKLWLPSLEDAFNIVDSSVHRVIKSIKHEPIKIVCQTAFATGWLMPRLHNFYDSHPDIELRLFTYNEIDDGPEIAESDGTILSGRGAWPEVKAHFLITNRFVPVCSPGYLERIMPIARPSDLLPEALIVSETNENVWRNWFAQYDINYSDSRRKLVFPTSFLPVQAAINGLGIALADRALIVQDLAHKRLVLPLSVPSLTPGTGWYFVHPIHRRLDAQFQEWSVWLRTQADSYEASVTTGL